MNTVINSKYGKIDIDLEIDISILNIRISTSKESDELINNEGLNESESFLIITSNIQIKDYESVSDVPALIRPKFLIALGIISFLTKKAFTPFQFSRSISKTVENLEELTEDKIIFNGENITADFIQLKAFIENEEVSKKRLLYSLLDRWRKALYLEEESEETMMFDDEVLLSYFHILELLASEYYKDQKKELQILVKGFTDNLMTNIFLSKGRKLESKTKEKIKLLEKVIVQDISVANKILYMLKQQDILTDRLTSFIGELIADRNSVAHGRQVYQDRVIYPVPPFFPLVKNRLYPFDTLRILSARTIAIFIQSNLHEEEWNESQEIFLPTIEEIDKFLKEKSYENLTNEDFINGKINDITPYKISIYLLENKLKPTIVITALKKFIINISFNEDEIMESIIAILVIIDFAEEELKKKCIEIIKIASKNRWRPFWHSSFRDMKYHLEYHGFKPKELEKLIANKEIR